MSDRYPEFDPELGEAPLNVDPSDYILPRLTRKVLRLICRNCGAAVGAVWETTEPGFDERRLRRGDTPVTRDAYDYEIVPATGRGTRDPSDYAIGKCGQCERLAMLPPWRELRRRADQARRSGRTKALKLTTTPF